MISLHSINSIAESEDATTIKMNISKIDRLLRLYSNAKAVDEALQNKCKQQVDILLKSCQTESPLTFNEIHQALAKRISEAFAEPQAKKAKSSVVTPPQIPSNSSFGSSSNKIMNEKSPIISGRVSERSNPDSAKLSSSSFASSVKNQPLKMQPEFHESGSRNQDSSDSSSKKATSVIRQFCMKNNTSIESLIGVNEDVVTYLKAMKPDRVALLGVQKPQNSEKDKLFLCTIMEFDKTEVLSLKVKSSDFAKESEQFSHVLRYPFALAVIGQNINDVKAHYGKFLLEMGSPIPMIIIFNQSDSGKSLVVTLKTKAIDEMEAIKMFQIERIDQKLIKDKSLIKMSLFSELTINQQKFVTTKILDRCPEKKVFESSNAISIEKDKKKTPEIETPTLEKKQVQQTPTPLMEPKRVEQGPNSEEAKTDQFNYMVHEKFMATFPKEQFYVYYLNEQNQLYLRKKVASIDDAAALVNSVEDNCIIGFTIKKDDKQIPSQTLERIYSCRARSPVFCIRFKGIAAHKVAFLKFKPNVSQGDFQVPLVFKTIPNDTHPAISLLIVISKANIAKYETKVQLTEA